VQLIERAEVALQFLKQAKLPGKVVPLPLRPVLALQCQPRTQPEQLLREAALYQHEVGAINKERTGNHGQHHGAVRRLQSTAASCPPQAGSDDP